MAVRISSSKFLESTVAKAAIISAATAPSRTDLSPLPAGIKNGVAKLLDIYFEDDPKDGEGFRAEAEIITPDIFNGQYVKGRITKQWIRYNADNLSDRLIRIGEVLRNLGGSILGDGKNANYIKIAEVLANHTKKAPIYFRFATNPKETGDWPYENWYNSIPGFVLPSATPAATDQKKTEPLVNGHTVKTDPLPWSDPASTVKGYQLVAVASAAPSVEYTDTDDLSSVITRAIAQDTAAMDKLDEWAKELGYSQEDLDEAPDYRVIGDWVSSGKPKEDATAIVDPPVREIKEGQVYSYSPPNKRAGGTPLKERQCKVLSVDNIRNLVKIENLAKKGEVFEVDINDENLK